MRGFGNIHSISARLKLMNIFVSGIALLLAFASFLAYDISAFKADLVHTLDVESQIIGANTASALMFGDVETANSTLAGLRGSPEVVSAVLLGPDGKRFAEYSRDDGKHPATVPPLPAGERKSQWKQPNGVLFGSRIVFKGQQLGTVYILGQPRDVGSRSVHYGVIAAVVLLLCMIIALVLTSAFRHFLTEPLIGLAQTAQIVRTHKDYSVRAKSSGQDDELALLVRSFNAMLDEIQGRDQALEESRHVLEERVEQRTAELSVANKELEAFSYTVAHDLRNPLDAIGNIGFLLRNAHEEQLDGDGRHLLDQLLGNTRKMSLLIRDLLNLSSAGRKDFRREMVDVSKTGASVLADLKAMEPGRQMEAKVADDLRALADPGLVRVVLENLLGNAWKYASKQEVAKIELGSFQQGAECVMYVRDNGAGFDPAYADRLFQPFQRLHVQSDFPGTGIGLATVDRIIQRHGGRIWAESSPGEGATFFFTLPPQGPEKGKAAADQKRVV